MKKVLSAILITILAYSVIFATTVFAASNIAIQTNSDYTANKTAESKDFATTVGSKIQLYVRLISNGQVGGNPLKNVQWGTSNVQVVAISETGLISALKAGTATITAKYDGGQDTIKITVGSGTPSTDVPGQDENTTSGGGSSGGGSSEQPSTGGESGSGSGSSSETPSTGTIEEGGISWPNISSAKFTMTKEQSVFLDAKLVVTNVSTSTIKAFNEKYSTNSIYAYFSKDSSSLKLEDSSVLPSKDPKMKPSLPTEAGHYDEKISFPVICYTTLLDNNTMSVSINADELYAIDSDFYGSLYATVYDNGTYITKELVAPKKITKPNQESWGNRIKFSFFESETYVAINEPTSYAQQSGNLYIGKITDDSIFDNFRKNKSDMFEKLAQYASAKNNLTAETKLDFSNRIGSGGTNQFVKTMKANDFNLQDGAYYYVYATLDGVNGKYKAVTDVDICRAQVNPDGNKALISTKDFGQGSNTGDGNSVLNGNLTKDPTTPDGKLPQTGVSEGILAMIAATAILTGVSFIVYSKNKDLR